jgi:hypothetical protein
MKKLWHYLKRHIQEDFNLKYYLSIAGLLAICLAVNYTLDIENSYLDYETGFRKFMGFFLMYSIPYYAATFLYFKICNRENFFLKSSFWITSLFGLLILSLDSSVPFLWPFIEANFHIDLRLWVYKVSVNMISFFTVFIPILVFYFFREKHDNSIYGLRPKQFDPRPYFVMLLIMLPVMIFVSFSESFLRQYPMYVSTSAHEYLHIGEWLTALCYEVAYGLDFITVELLFRGFLVLAMASVLGRGAVLTMAVVYCTLHFGKPIMEAMSSVFGGYILGVIAYETRSIWGGIIVHVGIAWMMEIIAFLQEHL